VADDSIEGNYAAAVGPVLSRRDVVYGMVARIVLKADPTVRFFRLGPNWAHLSRDVFASADARRVRELYGIGGQRGSLYFLRFYRFVLPSRGFYSGVAF